MRHNYGVLAILALFLLYGCSSVPPATKFHTGPQRKIQAAKHWDIMAHDVAKKIKAVVDKNPELAFRTIYLDTDDNSPFGETFKDMLRVNLFKFGMTLADNPEGSIHFKYKTKILHYNGDRVYGDYVTAEALGSGAVLLGTGAAFGVAAVSRAIDYSSFAAGQTALIGAAAGFGGAGLLEMAIASQFTSITNTEYLFSAEVECSGKIYDLYLDVYYINSEDAYKYIAQVNQGQYKSNTVMSGKTIRIVGSGRASSKR